MASPAPDITAWREHLHGDLADLDDLDRPGEHLWVIAGALAVTDPERPLSMPPAGGTVTGPGCFKCEREYSRKLARRPCTGSIA